jgi:phosphoribosylformimino-5-aminoimidazole carboxamide ribotide isomerase
MIIFPAVDILDGKCVRLKQGRYDAVTIYADDPAEMALFWEEQGASWLHIVDLDGAASGSTANLKAVEKICQKVTIPVQYGGGLRSEAAVKRLLNLGVQRVVLGTVLVKKPELATAMLKTFGDKIVAGIDARNGLVAVDGWQSETQILAVNLALDLKNKGLQRLIYTDVLQDGMRQGPNLASIKEMLEAVKLPLIGSGGVGSLGDLEALKELEALGLEGVIVGSALYEKVFTLKEALAVVA